MISNLDLIRSKVLKQTMQIALFDRIFRSRFLRLTILGLFAAMFYFLLSAYVPLWILLIGPALWGVPHLISSLRYNTLLGSSITNGKKLFYFQSALWFLVFVYRLSVDIFLIDLPLSQQPFLFEGLALILSFLFQVFLLGKISLRSVLYFLIFSLFLLITHDHPIEVALTLLIGHNYVPLFTWFQSCQQKKDLYVFLTVTTIYILLSFTLFFGLHESIYTYFKPQMTLPLLNWNFMSIFEPYGADLVDRAFWFRIVSLYAFSQSIHYFIWLKAIPENYQQQQYPPSFRYSLQKLLSDFGATSLVFLLGLTVVGCGYWFFFEYQSARIIYFAIASYHGFMEISCLPFLKSNRSQ